MKAAFFALMTLVSLTTHAQSANCEYQSSAVEGQTVMTVVGEAAKVLMERMIADERSELLSNSICRTTYKLGGTTCTLLGSHGGCPRPIKYACETNLGF